MSIEKLIEDNTAALARLTAAIEALGALTTRAEAAVAEVKKPARATNQPAKAEPPPSPPESPAPAEVVALSYAKDVQPLGIKLYTANRAALVKILQGYSVQKLDQIDEGAWPDVVKELQDELAKVGK